MIYQSGIRKQVVTRYPVHKIETSNIHLIYYTPEKSIKEENDYETNYGQHLFNSWSSYSILFFSTPVNQFSVVQ